jgi:hypothetical protein
MAVLQNQLPIAEAVEQVIGSRPHVQTVRRWVKQGVRGIRLQALFVNGAYLTTLESVREFIDATTSARLEPSTRPKVEVVKPVVAGRVAAAVAEFNRMKSGSKAK